MASSSNRVYHRQLERDQDEHVVFYLQKLKQIPLLTVQQELQETLRFKRALQKKKYYEKLMDAEAHHTQKVAWKKKCDLWEKVYESSKDKLVKSNIRLVLSIASRYRSRSLELADLINEGIVGLIEALHRFDPARGFKLSTYSTWWIKQAITTWVNNTQTSMQFSLRFHKLLKRYRLTVQYLLAEKQVMPTIEEVADFMNVSRKKIHMLQAYQQKALSFEQPISTADEEMRLADVIEDSEADPYQLAYQERLAETIVKIFLGLGERERKILKSRYGFSGDTRLTLKETGKRLGLTRERIRQIQMEILKRLRQEKTLSDLR